MSPLTILWIASVVGAGLFFVSGYLSSQVFHRAAHVAPGPLAHAALAGEPEQEGLQLEVSRVQSLAQVARREAEALRQKLATEMSTNAELSRDLFEARGVVDQLQRKLSEVQKSAAAVPTLQQKLEEHDRTQSARARASDQLQRRAAELEHQLVEATNTVERLQAQLAVQVDGANAALSNDVKRLNEEQQERNVRLKMLTHRVAELETYAEQNAALRSERDALSQEVENLRRTAREALAPPAPPRMAPRVQAVSMSRPSQSGTTRRVNDSERTLESSLKQNFVSLVTREPGLVAVLSDDNGFAVAGVGSEHEQEAVSVLTSLAQQLATRVQEFVNLEHIERMELADAAGRALRIRFFDCEAQPLALGCLGKRSLVPNADEELVVSTFPKILRRAWSA